LTGWKAIVIGGGETTAYDVGAPESLLAPISGRIEKAALIRVEAYGEWRKVDVHALAFEGAPLVARVAVAYPLGLHASAHVEAERAVVVGDPTGDLPRAHGEAKAVARTLAAQGPVVALLGTAATRRAALDAMTGAGTFHYAGHGLYAGEDGFESALPLAGGARITIGDVLALAPAPRRVVLSGCDAARSDAEGLGLAQAFLAAGSEEVVAPVRPVADTLAEALANALYGAPQPSLARALRAAQLAVRAADPAADWSAFRALAP
jgi:CHAT domain-containing protein